MNWKQFKKNLEEAARYPSRETQDILCIVINAIPEEPTQEPEEVLCTACYGKGYHSQITRESGSGDFPGDPAYDSGHYERKNPCSRCNGSGKQPKKPAEESGEKDYEKVHAEDCYRSGSGHPFPRDCGLNRANPKNAACYEKPAANAPTSEKPDKLGDEEMVPKYLADKFYNGWCEAADKIDSLQAENQKMEKGLGRIKNHEPEEWEMDSMETIDFLKDIAKEALKRREGNL